MYVCRVPSIIPCFPSGKADVIFQRFLHLHVDVRIRIAYRICSLVTVPEFCAVYIKTVFVREHGGVSVHSPSKSVHTHGILLSVT